MQKQFQDKNPNTYAAASLDQSSYFLSNNLWKTLPPE